MILNLPTFSWQRLLAPGPRDTSITVLRLVMAELAHTHADTGLSVTAVGGVTGAVTIQYSDNFLFISASIFLIAQLAQSGHWSIHSIIRGGESWEHGDVETGTHWSVSGSSSW